MSGPRMPLSRGTVMSNYSFDNSKLHENSYNLDNLDQWKSEIHQQAKFIDKLNQKDKAFVNEQK